VKRVVFILNGLELSAKKWNTESAEKAQTQSAQRKIRIKNLCALCVCALSCNSVFLFGFWFLGRICTHLISDQYIITHHGPGEKIYLGILAFLPIIFAGRTISFGYIRSINYRRKPVNGSMLLLLS